MFFAISIAIAALYLKIAVRNLSNDDGNVNDDGSKKSQFQLTLYFLGVIYTGFVFYVHLA